MNYSTQGQKAVNALPAFTMILVGLALGGIAGPAQAEGLPNDPLEGRRWFVDKSCSRCHGLERAELAGGPGLGEGRFQGSFLDLGAALWNHAPQMDAGFEMSGMTWPRLNEEEARELLVFLYFMDYLGRPGNPERGASIFRDRGCSACHNLGGGRSRKGPDLASLKSHASPLAVAQEIWNHGPAMLEAMQNQGIRPPHFAPGDLADLSAFIRRQAGPQAGRPLLLAPGNPNEGERLFLGKGCARCHGTSGTGGSGGPDLSRFDLHISAEAIAGTMWNHSLEMNRSMQALGLSWPRFQESELADLVAFLYFLPFQDDPGDPEKGEETYISRSCSGCHNGETGTLQGPDLRRSFQNKTPSALVAAMWNHAPIMKKAILRQGLPWPSLNGEELRNLHAYLNPKSDSEKKPQ